MNTHPSRVSSALTIAFYTLAVIAFVLALAILFGVFNLSATMQSNAFLIRNTVSLAADTLMAWLLFVAQFADGLMVWALGITGILLVGGGRMMARDASLVTRVLRLETFLGINPAGVKTNKEPMDQQSHQAVVFNQGSS